VIEFGVRNLSLHCALSHRTVARVLELLREEPDPLIDLVSRRRLARADRYQLRIPDAYAASANWRRRRAGRIEAIHPAFLVLGGVPGLVYEALSQAPARGAEIARTARLSASAVSTALRVLADHGLADHGREGWRRGDVTLQDVAESCGASDIHRERVERYRRDRQSWQARLRQYQGRPVIPVSERDGWWSLDDPDEFNELCRWPLIAEDAVRAPPSSAPASGAA